MRRRIQKTLDAALADRIEIPSDRRQVHRRHFESVDPNVCQLRYRPTKSLCSQCEIALGRPLDEAEDDLNDPDSIFRGHIFKAFVGFRKTDKPRGGTSAP